MSDESVYTVAVWGVKTPSKGYFVTGVKTPAGYGVGINFAPHGLKMDMQAVVTQVVRKMDENEFIQAVTEKMILGGMLPEVDGPVKEHKCVEVRSTADAPLDSAYSALEEAGYEILLPEISGMEGS